MPIESFIVGAAILAAALIAGITLKRQQARHRADEKAALDARDADGERSQPQPDPPPTTAMGEARSEAPATNSTVEQGPSIAAAVRGSVNASDGSSARSTKNPIHRALHTHFFAMLKELGPRAKP